MKKNKINRTAFTIFEVLVASVVVSIIMLGVITAFISLSGSARYFAGSFFVSQTTQTMLNSILTQASMAVGSYNEPGVVGVSNFIKKDSNGVDVADADPGSGDSNTFCFHQNISLSDSTRTGPNYHRWFCYTYISNNIYWCLNSYDVANPPGSFGWSDDSKPGACAASADKYLGKAKELPSTTFSLGGISGASKSLFEITINACLDPTRVASCVEGNTDNPYIQKKGSVSPSGHNS